MESVMQVSSALFHVNVGLSTFSSVYAFGNGGPNAPPTPMKLLGGESGEFAERCLFGGVVCHVCQATGKDEWQVYPCVCIPVFFGPFSLMQALWQVDRMAFVRVGVVSDGYVTRLLDPKTYAGRAF